LLKGFTLKCNLIRRRESYNGPSNYFLHLNDNNRFLMSARSFTENGLTTYMISLDALKHEGSNKYIGKIKSNISGTMYDIWDNGIKLTKLQKGEEVRKNIGCITYVK